MIEKKVCNTCGDYKELELFSINLRAKDNRANICKGCINKRHEIRKAKKAKGNELLNMMLPI